MTIFLIPLKDLSDRGVVKKKFLYLQKNHLVSVTLFISVFVFSFESTSVTVCQVELKAED